MNNQSTNSELMKLIKTFCEARDWDQFHNPKDLAIGISTEANELLDLFRFKSEEDMAEMLQNQKKREKIQDELADVFFFVLRFAQKNDIDLDRVLENKMRKNDDKYPVSLAKGKNLKYSEYEKEL